MKPVVPETFAADPAVLFALPGRINQHLTGLAALPPPRGLGLKGGVKDHNHEAGRHPIDERARWV